MRGSVRVATSQSSSNSASARKVVAALALMAGERKADAAFAFAEPLSPRGLERPSETLVAWARAA
jgi:hypothetical protein